MASGCRGRRCVPKVGKLPSYRGGCALIAGPDMAFSPPWPAAMYETMLSCWGRLPSERPAAATLETLLMRMAGVECSRAHQGGETPLGMSSNPLLNMADHHEESVL